MTKQIWRDVARFSVGNKHAEAIQTHEFNPSQYEDENLPSDNFLSRLVKTIFEKTERIIFFGLRWTETFPEMAELGHMDRKKIGSSDVLLLRSVEEFTKTPLQKRELMKIIDGWR